MALAANEETNWRLGIFQCSATQYSQTLCGQEKCNGIVYTEVVSFFCFCVFQWVCISNLECTCHLFSKGLPRTGKLPKMWTWLNNIDQYFRGISVWWQRVASPLHLQTAQREWQNWNAHGNLLEPGWRIPANGSRGRVMGHTMAVFLTIWLSWNSQSVICL